MVHHPLRTCRLFAGLPAGMLEVLAERCPPPIEVAAQEVVYEPGDDLDGLWVALAMSAVAAKPFLRVELLVAGGSDPTLFARIGEDEVFGELELSAVTARGRSGRRRSRATAVTPARLLLVPREELATAASQVPELSVRIAGLAVGRLLTSLELQARRRACDIDLAVASVLADFAISAGRFDGMRVTFPIRVTQDQLATELGVSRRSIVECCAAWSARGLIETNPIALPDYDRIRLMADLIRGEPAAVRDEVVAELRAREKSGAFYDAFVLATDFIERFPQCPVIAHQAALAAARMGAADEARAIMRRAGLWLPSLKQENERSAFIILKTRVAAGLATVQREGGSEEEETDPSETNDVAIDCAALAARLSKDATFALPRGAERDVGLRETAELYEAVYEASPASFPAINAASMRAGLGDRVSAERMTHAVRALTPPEGGAEWDRLIGIEAALIEGRIEEAVEQAATLDVSAGRLASFRLQIERLSECDITGAGRVLNVLPSPRAVVFAGPLTLASEANREREAEEKLKEAVKRILLSCLAAAIYGALARGSDIVMAEAALALGIDLHVVLPVEPDAFRALSVTRGLRRTEAEAWGARYSACLEQAASLTILDDNAITEAAIDPSFQFGWRQSAGRAALHARALRTPAVMIAAVPADKERPRPHRVGGTLHSLDTWRASGREAVMIEVPTAAPTTARQSLGSFDPFGATVFVHGPEKELVHKASDLGAAAEAPIGISVRAENAIFALPCRDASEAVELARKMLPDAALPSGNLQVILDYGAYRSWSAETGVDPRSLKKMRGAQAVSGLPDGGRLLATATFAAEAALAQVPVDFYPVTRQVMRHGRVRNQREALPGLFRVKFASG